MKQPGREKILSNGTEYQIIAGCNVCGGAVFSYIPKPDNIKLRKLFQCLPCRRIYHAKNGKLYLWIQPIKNTEELKQSGDKKNILGRIFAFG